MIELSCQYLSVLICICTYLYLSKLFQFVVLLGQSTHSIQAQFINLEVAKKKQQQKTKKTNKKNSANILTYIKVSTFYSVSNC